MKALPKGQYIKHFQYGLGVITESGDQSTSIDFDIHGMKKFVNGLFVACAASSSSATSNAFHEKAGECQVGFSSSSL